MPAPGGADFAADTELDAVGRWTARTICGYASLHHACASLSQDEVKREVNRVMPDYDLLSLILRGEAMAALDGCRVVGLTPTGTSEIDSFRGCCSRDRTHRVSRRRSKGILVGG